MNATKRKFNALLQGLSNPPPADQGKPAGKKMDHEALLQKRRRLGFPESTAPKLDSPSPGITGLASSLKRPASGVDVRRDVPARYSPNDRDELLRRLATFQEITDWTPKPDKINEVEWARRGWICRGKEKVGCQLCHKELVVTLKRETNAEADEAEAEAEAEVDESAAAGLEEALVNKYAELIVTCHQSDCLWRRQGCDGSLLRLSFSSTKTVLDALRQRYQELSSRRAFLPYEFNFRLPEGMDLDQVTRQLPSGFFAKDEASEDSPVNRPALALALVGWQGLTNPRIGAVPNSVSCHTCLRRLGLWMFKSKEVDEHGHVVVAAPMDHLDPVREHRFFCPWRNASCQSRRSSSPDHVDEPAWKMLLQSVKNEADLQSVYEGRWKSPSKTVQKPATAPSTPARATTAPSDGDEAASSGIGPHVTPTAASIHGMDEDEAARNAKDKERWARLRKVKSLFDTKKLKRSMSIRPGTSHSVRSAKE